MRSTVKLIAICLLFFGGALTSCSSAVTSTEDMSSNENSTTINIESSTDNTEISMNSSQEPTDTLKNKSNYSLSEVNLADSDFSETILEVPNFKASDYVKGEFDSLRIIAAKDDNVYLELDTCNYDDTGDIQIICCNINTGATELFKGKFESYNSSVATYALADNKIFFTYDSFEEQVHCMIDTINKDVSVLKTEPLNVYTDSFVYTHPLDDTNYIEEWFDIDGNNITYHVMLYSPEGEKEILTKQGNRRREVYTYAVCGDKLYEYAQTNNLTEPYLNTYDLDGNLLSSEYLAEVANELKEDEEDGSYALLFSVFNNCFLIEIGNEMPTKKFFLYNTDSLSLTVLDEVIFYSSPNPVNNEQPIFIFRSDIPSNDSEYENLYCINESGHVKGLIQNIKHNYYCTDYKNVYYLEDDKLFYVKL